MPAGGRSDGRCGAIHAILPATGRSGPENGTFVLPVRHRPGDRGGAGRWVEARGNRSAGNRSLIRWSTGSTRSARSSASRPRCRYDRPSGCAGPASAGSSPAATIMCSALHDAGTFSGGCCTGCRGGAPTVDASPRAAIRDAENAGPGTTAREPKNGGRTGRRNWSR